MRSSALGLLGAALLVSTADAAPCVGSGHDVPFPGATSIETLQVDVPSAQFPGLWQQGLIGSYTYQIFGNRTGNLRGSLESSAWSIELNCQESLCTRDVSGTPPRSAWDTSKRLEACFGTLVVATPEPVPVPEHPPAVASEEPPAPEPEVVEPAKVETATEDPAPTEPTKTDQAVEEPSATEQVVAAPVAAEPAITALEGADPVASAPLAATPTGAPTAPQSGGGTRPAGGQVGQCFGPQVSASIPANCKPVARPDANPVITLQRLLVSAGADPGPIDGAYGPTTEEAVLQVLGFAGRGLDVPTAISAIEGFLCLQGQ